MLGCLEIPAFPLQLLLKQRPDWQRAAAELPVVVVAEDRPQGLVTHVNAAARRAGILPGQRYAHALGLAREVRAGVVPPGVVGAGIALVLSHLRAYSPNIEPSEDEPGVFWVDVSGLGGLYETLLSWGRTVLADLAREGLSALASIGFSRFGTYAGVKSLTAVSPSAALAKAAVSPSAALAKAAVSPSAALAKAAVSPSAALAKAAVSPSEQLRVMTHPEAERTLAMQVPLAYLAISPGVRDRLERLGVRTLGELMALPAAGVMKRWGPEAHALHRLACGLSGQITDGLPGLRETGDRLKPMPEVMPARVRVLLDFLEHDAHRLLFRIKSLLDEVLAIVRERQALVAELLLDLGFEARGAQSTTLRQHRFRPAAPTLDGALLIDLVRLRLESVDLTTGLVELRLEALETAANPEQMRLFKLGTHQDGAAAARALARVQAELGEGAVGTMALRDAHLPRARQGFEPLVFDHTSKSLPAPLVTAEPGAPLPFVRRLHQHPEPLPPRPRDLRNDGWQPRDPAQGTIVAVHGPFVVAGGWWLAAAGERGTPNIGEGSEVHREYAFVETKRGDLLWIYHDRRRRRWFEEGRIE